jgi:hypothetical protein
MNREYLAAHPQPFIVWALQRTGGTNLTYKLDQISGLPSIDSEPFNPGHQYGQVTRNWLESRDRGRLDAAVQAVVDIGGIIKHCVEAVPWEISESLARASTLAGYRHLFLYRRNALNRLLSLRFAALTGIWNHEWKTRNNAQLAADGDPNQNVELAIESALELALPVEELVCREQLCVKLLNRAWALLDALQAKPVALAFEDVYQSDNTESLLQILGPFVVPDSSSYHAVLLRCWLDSVIRFGEQGTRDKYSQFPGVADLAWRLQFVAPPFFSTPVDDKPLKARNSAMARWSGTAAFGEGERRQFRLASTDGQEFTVGEIWLAAGENPDTTTKTLV